MQLFRIDLASTIIFLIFCDPTSLALGQEEQSPGRISITHGKHAADWFRKYDKDQDWRLSKSEFKNMNYPPVDANGDGLVDMPESIEWNVRRFFGRKSAQPGARKDVVAYSIEDLSKLIKHFRRVKSREYTPAVAELENEWDMLNKDWLAIVGKLNEIQDRQTLIYRTAKAEADAIRDKLSINRNQWLIMVSEIAFLQKAELKKLVDAADQLLFRESFSIGGKTVRADFVNSRLDFKYGELAASYKCQDHTILLSVEISLDPEQKGTAGKYLDRYPLVMSYDGTSVFRVNGIEVKTVTEVNRLGVGELRVTPADIEEDVVRKAINFENLEALN